MAMVMIRLGETLGGTDEGTSEEEEDTAQMGVSPLGETACALVAAGLMEGGVEAGISDEVFGGREAGDILDFG